jgi:hypothetical protein
VVVLLVPALEVDRVLAAPGQLQAQYLGVVGGGQLKVGGADVDVGKAQDSHGASRAWEILDASNIPRLVFQIKIKRSR